jgi:hypothetical protein
LKSESQDSRALISPKEMGYIEYVDATKSIRYDLSDERSLVALTMIVKTYDAYQV